MDKVLIDLKRNKRKWGTSITITGDYIIMCSMDFFSHWWDDGRCLGWDTRECTVRRTSDIISRFKYSSKIHEANTKGT